MTCALQSPIPGGQILETTRNGGEGTVAFIDRHLGDLALAAPQATRLETTWPGLASPVVTLKLSSETQVEYQERHEAAVKLKALDVEPCPPA